MLQLERNVLTELPAEYNLQLIVGLQYLYKAKVLHFFSNTDKPLLEISSESFLQEVKKYGLTDSVKQKLLNPLSTFLPYTTLVRNEDFYYVYSRDYSMYRRILFHGELKEEHYSLIEMIFYTINRIVLRLELYLVKIIKKIQQLNGSKK